MSKAPARRQPASLKVQATRDPVFCPVNGWIGHQLQSVVETPRVKAHLADGGLKRERVDAAV